MKLNITSGGFVKKENIKDNTEFEIVNECVEKDSDKFTKQDGSPQKQYVAKVRYEGCEEPENLNINFTTICALVDAFGNDTKEWIGKKLTGKVREATTGLTIYLVPEGYDLVRGSNKRLVIKKI